MAREAWRFRGSGARLVLGQSGGRRGIHAADLSSFSAPRATILLASSGSGLCSALASSQGARIQTSRSSSVIRMTGMAFGWIGSTTAFATGGCWRKAIVEA
jgi:hypothetical protein